VLCPETFALASSGVLTNSSSFRASLLAIARFGGKSSSLLGLPALRLRLPTPDSRFRGRGRLRGRGRFGLPALRLPLSRSRSRSRLLSRLLAFAQYSGPLDM
jgi:hypothetical protein